MRVHTLAIALAAVVATQPGPSVAQEVREPWVRGTVQGQKATGAFMEIRATTPSALVAAASPVAGVVELHEMAMDGGVMKMRAIPRLDVAPGRALDLKPGGYHVMLMDLQKQLTPGERVPLTLHFERPDKSRFSVQVDAEVRPLNSNMKK